MKRNDKQTQIDFCTSRRDPIQDAVTSGPLLLGSFLRSLGVFLAFALIASVIAMFSSCSIIEKSAARGSTQVEKSVRKVYEYRINDSSYGTSPDEPAASLSVRGTGDGVVSASLEIGSVRSRKVL